MIIVNGNVVECKTYPNGELITKGLEIYKLTNRVELRFENNEELMLLWFCVKEIKEKSPKSEVILMLPYIPYSRMDREIGGYIFSLKYFADFINSMNFDEVRYIDAHSGVSSALIHRGVDLSPAIKNLIGVIKDNDEYDYILFPDNGAMKRYSELGIIDEGVGCLFASKKRNLSNGRIDKLDIVNPPNLKGKTVLIVDDLCAFGGTFIKAGHLLKKLGAERVILYVTHCEDNIAKGEILCTDIIDKVYTTNSICTIEHPKLFTILEFYCHKK